MVPKHLFLPFLDLHMLVSITWTVYPSFLTYFRTKMAVNTTMFNLNHNKCVTVDKHYLYSSFFLGGGGEGNICCIVQGVLYQRHHIRCQVCKPNY